MTEAQTLAVGGLVDQAELLAFASALELEPEIMRIALVRADGAIGVHNECVTDAGGLDQIDGVATVVDARTNARLTVVLDMPR